MRLRSAVTEHHGRGEAVLAAGISLGAYAVARAAPHLPVDIGVLCLHAADRLWPPSLLACRASWTKKASRMVMSPQLTSTHQKLATELAQLSQVERQLILRTAERLAQPREHVVLSKASLRALVGVG